MKSRKNKIINENLEHFIRSRFSTMAKNIHESWFAKQVVGSAMRNQKNLSDLEDHLHGLYASHLKLRPSYVRTVLKEHARTHPGPKPSPTYVDSSGNIQPTANYQIILSQWDLHRKEHQEYTSLRNQIDALHIQEPQIGRLARDIQSSQTDTRKQISAGMRGLRP